MTDILDRARRHEWWHSDRMMAEDLMFEIVQLRQHIVELNHELDELYTDRQESSNYGKPRLR